MAEIDSLEKIIKKPRVRKNKKNKESVSSSNSRTLLSSSQWDALKFLLGGIIVVLFVGICTILVSYFQFVQNTYNEYKNVINNYNNDKWTSLDFRIKTLENTVSTHSANTR
jgi:hypothetical protein